jgi:hypothetical protein
MARFNLADLDTKKLGQELGSAARVTEQATKVTNDFARAMQLATTVADNFAAMSEGAVGKGSKGSEGGSGSGDQAEGTSRIVGAMQNAARQSTAVWSAVGPRITAELERVSGATITMFRRIDASMKFPKIDAVLTTVRDGLTSVAAKGTAAFARVTASLVKMTSSLAQADAHLKPLALGTGALAIGVGALGLHFTGLTAAISAAAASAGVWVPLMAQAAASLPVVAAAAVTLTSALAPIVIPATAATAAVVGIGQAVYRVRTIFGSFGDVAGKTFSQIFRLGALAGFKPLSASASQATLSVRGLSSEIVGFGRNLLAAMGAIGIAYKLVEFFGKAIKGAKDLAETVDATGRVFGESAPSIIGYADEMAKSYGKVKDEILGTANTFGAFASAAGLSGDKAADFAKTATHLAVELGSLKNLGVAEAADKIRSALAGQTEPLRQYGVIITEEAVKQKALAMGFATASNAISEQAKVAARAILVQEGLATATNNIEETQDSAANVFRKLAGQAQNFATDVGTKLLPVVLGGVEVFNAFRETIANTFGGGGGFITDFVTGAVDSLKTFAKMIRNFDVVWEIMQLSAKQAFANITAVGATLPENFSRWFKWLGENWFNLLNDWSNIFLTFMGNLLSNGAVLGKALWNAIQGKDWTADFKPFLDGFEATAEALPETLKPVWTDMSDELTGLWDKFEQRGTVAAKKVAGEAKKFDFSGADFKGQAAGGVEKKFASGAELGSKEAYEAILKASGQKKDDPMKKLGDTAKDQLEVQKQQLELMKKQQAQPAIPVMDF